MTSNYDCPTFTWGLIADDCSLRWTDTASAGASWETWFYLFSAWSIVIQVVVLVASSYQLYFTVQILRVTKRAIATAPPFIILLSLIIGSLLRILFFAIDPHNYRKIFPAAVEGMMLTIPVMMWLSSNFLLTIYWLELQSDSMKRIEGISKLRPLLYIGIVLIVILALPVAIYNAISLDGFSGLLYNVALGLLLIALIIISSVSGIRFRMLLRRAWKSNVPSAYDNFMNKLTNFIFGLDVGLILAFLLLTMFTFLPRNDSYPWSWLVMQFLLRTDEFFVCAVMWAFASRKNPKQELEDTKRAASSSNQSGQSRSKQETQHQKTVPSTTSDASRERVDSIDSAQQPNLNSSGNNSDTSSNVELLAMDKRKPQPPAADGVDSSMASNVNSLPQTSTTNEDEIDPKRNQDLV